MARPPRLDFPGAFLYVSARSGRGLELFPDDQDRLYYLQTAESLALESGRRILAFCLLDHEVHLVLKSGRDEAAGTLSFFMKSLNQRYSRRWSARHGSSGHLFESRFRSLLVDENRYLVPLVGYLHRLPLSLALTEDFDACPWTSHAVYSGLDSVVSVDTEPVRELLLRDTDLSFRDRYRQLMGQDHGEVALFIREARKSGVLGGADYLEGHPVPFPEGRRITTAPSAHTFNELIEAVKAVYGVTEPELIGRGRKDPVSVPREVLSYLAVNELRKPVGHVALYLRRDQSLVSRIIQKLKGRPGWRDEVRRVREHLAEHGSGSTG